MVSWALITDVIDYSEIKNGIREDGSVYALYSFARKLGQALAAGLSGWLLTGIGYDSQAAANQLGQSEAVKQGIFNISTLVPALGFIALGLVLWLWYPLHKKQVDANVEKLKELHAAQEATQPGEPLAIDVPATPIENVEVEDEQPSEETEQPAKDDSSVDEE